MTQAICTRVNRNSIRELLEWLERETVVRIVIGGSIGECFEVYEATVDIVTISFAGGVVDFCRNACCDCRWSQDATRECYNIKLVTSSTFKAAVKLACPKGVE